MLLEEGADPALTDDKGRTPLHYACEGGRKGTIHLLLAAFMLLEEAKEKKAKKVKTRGKEAGAGQGGSSNLPPVTSYFPQRRSKLAKSGRVCGSSMNSRSLRRPRLQLRRP